MAEKDFRLNQAGNLPDETWRRLMGNKGLIKTKRRLNVRYLGTHSIFRLTSISGTKFVFEVYSPREGLVLAMEIPSDGTRKNYEDMNYFGECFIGRPSIELEENLLFIPSERPIRIVRSIQKIEILEEHPCFPE